MWGEAPRTAVSQLQFDPAVNRTDSHPPDSSAPHLPDEPSFFVSDDAPQSAASPADPWAEVFRSLESSSGHNCQGREGAGARDGFLRALDAAWRPLARHRAEALRAKGTRWHNRRANALGRSLQKRTAECGSTDVVVRCRCEDRRVPVLCGVRFICGRCRERHRKRMEARLVRSLGEQVRGAWDAWHKLGRPALGKPMVLLTTLTVRHSGDPRADMARLTLAWKRWRSWLHSRVGVCAFVRVTEVTPGRDELGHVHQHVVLVAPFFDWKEANRAWVRATEGASNHLDFLKVSSRHAAQYAAKYSSKGIGYVSLFTPELAASSMDALYARRMVTASQGFWIRRDCACKRCGEKRRLVSVPPSRDWVPYWRVPDVVIRIEGGLPDD